MSPIIQNHIKVIAAIEEDECFLRFHKNMSIISHHTHEFCVSTELAM